MKKAMKNLNKTYITILLTAAKDGQQTGGLTEEQIKTLLEELRVANVEFFRQVNL